MLWTFSNFVCNLRIGSSSFSILVTKLSDCSFYEKQAVHARFGLAYTLQTFSNFACNLIIGSSSLSILVTKLSDHSFYEKWAVHARFGLVWQALRWLLLWEIGRACTFWASVRTCMLKSFSNFTCNLRIGPSSFSILVTKLSVHSFYEKWSVNAHIGLACTQVRSKHFQKFCASLGASSDF